MSLEQLKDLVWARVNDQVQNPNFIPREVMEGLAFESTDSSIPVLYEIVYAIEYNKEFPVDVVVGKDKRPLYVGRPSTTGMSAMQGVGLKLMPATFDKYICSITPDDGKLYNYICTRLTEAHESL